MHISQVYEDLFKYINKKVCSILEQKYVCIHTHTTVYLLLQVLYIARRNCFRMVIFYTLLSNMHLSESPLLILNQIILFISSVIWVLLVSVLSTSLLMKNYTMDQILYTYQGRCSKRGIIPNRPTLCKICEQNDDIMNGLTKRSAYEKKKQLIKISCYIGEFHLIHYCPMLKKYAYHRMLLFLLVKHQFNNIRREYF